MKIIILFVVFSFILIFSCDSNENDEKPISEPQRGYILSQEEGEVLMRQSKRGTIKIKVSPQTGSQNMAMGTQNLSPHSKIPTEELWNAINTNSVGAFIVIREFLPFMNRGGRIINVSSGAGALLNMGSYAPAYSISKTTLNAITKQFASVLKDKEIAINSVCPGWVRTDMGGKNAPRSVKMNRDNSMACNRITN